MSWDTCCICGKVDEKDVCGWTSDRLYCGSCMKRLVIPRMTKLIKAGFESLENNPRSIKANLKMQKLLSPLHDFLSVGAIISKPLEYKEKK